MRTFLGRCGQQDFNRYGYSAVSHLFFLLLAAANSAAVTKNPYPKELQGLKLYARYLGPLVPLQSNGMQVRQVLGLNEDLDSENWNDLVSTIVMLPKHRVSFRQLKMPPMFSRSVGGVSQINVACDIYSDDFGLPRPTRAETYQ